MEENVFSRHPQFSQALFDPSSDGWNYPEPLKAVVDINTLPPLAHSCSETPVIFHRVRNLLEVIVLGSISSKV